MNRRQAASWLSQPGIQAAIHDPHTKEAINVAIRELTQPHWIPCSERLPEVNKDGGSGYILLSLSNYSLPTIGRYQVDDEGGAFFDGDNYKPLVSYGLFVNARMPLMEPYTEE